MSHSSKLVLVVFIIKNRFRSKRNRPTHPLTRFIKIVCFCLFLVIPDYLSRNLDFGILNE